MSCLLCKTEFTENNRIKTDPLIKYPPFFTAVCITCHSKREEMHCNYCNNTFKVTEVIETYPAQVICYYCNNYHNYSYK